MNFLGHFKTITHHKLLVMGYCFRVGLIWQGLMHDMSKYSPSEFLVGARYYSGIRSPNAAQREELGYSTAWLHHKGRNRHHLEYWTDYGGQSAEMVGQPMPTKYMVELCLDRIAACRVYNGKDYTPGDPLIYLEKSRDSRLMHPQTQTQVLTILTMLAEKGEKETLRYIRKEVLKHPVKLYPNLPPPTVDPGCKDDCFIPPEELSEICKDIPTPFYLYDEETIVQNAEMVRQAFRWNPGHRQFFPVKATPTAGILSLLREHGQGAVCSSAAELELCRRCGFSPEEILFLPNYPRAEDMEKAREIGCPVILDSLELLEDFAQYGLLRGTVGLRITPEGIFRFGNQEVRTEGNKFGLTPRQGMEVARRLRELGVTNLGLHGYLSGNTLTMDYYPQLTEMLMDTALELSQILPVSYLDISGGLGIPYEPGEKPLDIVTLGQLVQNVFQDRCSGGRLPNLGLYTELGRFVTGPGGVLVTKVTLIKKTGRNFAGVDASAADLMRPMMYGAYHHISVLGKEQTENRELWDVVGAVCENTDKLAENRLLPPLNRGDILLIHDTGAHGHSMGYQYGGRLRCGEYLRRRDGSIQCLRRRQTVEDYLETQVFQPPNPSETVNSPKTINPQTASANTACPR